MSEPAVDYSAGRPVGFTPGAADLRHALAKQQFVLFFQPQWKLHSGRLAGLEALIRWQHPLAGLIGPDHFIGLAEQSGTIIAIGQWVMQACCEQLHRWEKAGISVPPVAVNLSAVELENEGFLRSVSDTTSRWQVAASHLEFEVTESAAATDETRYYHQVEALAQCGHRVVIDDFGTGYSSLARLRSMPVSALKIDRSFVSQAPFDPASASIVRATVSMAHEMNLSVVAEGVETLAQLAFVRRAGCDAVQGFLTGMPLPASAVPSLPGIFGFSDESEQTRPRQTLLVVDDEPAVRSAILRELHGEGYHILQAGSAGEALELLARNAVEVILSDQRMPGGSGVELFNKVKTMYPRTIRMIISGYTDIVDIVGAINDGAVFKFIHKPWDTELLRTHVQQAFLTQKALLPGNPYTNEPVVDLMTPKRH